MAKALTFKVQLRGGDESFMPNKVLRAQAPELLLDFYEKRLVLHF